MEKFALIAEYALYIIANLLFFFGVFNRDAYVQSMGLFMMCVYLNRRMTRLSNVKVL